MSADESNPYDGYGKIVTGDRLVGRGEIVADVSSKVRQCNGSVALVGLPRVGKSSIAKTALLNCVDDQIIRIWIDVGSLAGEVDLFRALAEELAYAALDYQPPGSLYDGDDYAVFRHVARWCQRVRDDSRHVILVLDEFDSIRNHPDADTVIRRFRELIYDTSKYGVSAIMATRRPLWWIERKHPDLSTLAGACETIHVRPLDRDRASQIASRGGERVASAVGDPHLWLAAGGHPYLTEMLLHGVWRGLSVEGSLAVRRSEIDAYFEQVVAILESDGIVNAADVLDTARIPAEIAHLRALGLVTGEDNRLWSSDFDQYLRGRVGRTNANSPWSTDLE